jgi:hypothetical protein
VQRSDGPPLFPLFQPVAGHSPPVAPRPLVAPAEAAERTLGAACVEGRADDLLRYGGLVVHPLVVRSVLVSTPEAVEYQVRQTPRGIDLAVIAPDGLDERSLAGRLTAALQRAGLAAPNVSVRRVAALDRHPQTGKAKRFITSPSESVGSCLGPQEAHGGGRRARGLLVYNKLGHRLPRRPAPARTARRPPLTLAGDGGRQAGRSLEPVEPTGRSVGLPVVGWRPTEVPRSTDSPWGGRVCRTVCSVTEGRQVGS